MAGLILFPQFTVIHDKHPCIEGIEDLGQQIVFRRESGNLHFFTPQLEESG